LNRLSRQKPIARTQPKEHRVSKRVSKPSPSPLGPKKHKKQKHQVTPLEKKSTTSEFKEMLAKFRDMRISEGQGSKEVSDQEMGNT